MAKRPMEVPEALPYPIVDNHTHLESVIAFRNNEITVEKLLSDAYQAGVTRIIQVGCDLNSATWTDTLLRDRRPVVSRRGVAAPQPTDGAYETTNPSVEGVETNTPSVVGSFELPSVEPVETTASAPQPNLASVLGAIAIHPNEAVLHAKIHEIAKDGLEPNPLPHHEFPLDEAIQQIYNIAKDNPKIRAIGETGMDLFRAGTKGEKAQAESFRAHIQMAKELDLALQIHDREAHSQVIDILLKDGAPAKTVFHCFSGDADMAKFCATQGWYLSFAGPVTYKANDELRAALAQTPLDLLLVETDAPYLTPHPYRGQANAPYAANYTTRAIAEYLNRPLTEICEAISKNSERVYGPWN